MTYRALIIDDDPGIVEEVADIVESLEEHVSESAACMHSARERLATGVYDYILLDLEIPVQAGRNIARIQNGINLLKEIRRTRSTPIIVMTGHGNDGPDQAVEAMRAGATDYISKPFKRSKRVFDEIIRGVLPANSAAATRPTVTKKFEGSEMVFYPDRVELSRVKVCGKRGIMRVILNTLRERLPNGRYKGFYGEDLARLAKAARGQNAAAEAIRGFRQKVQQILLEELNIECGADDVIENDRRHGYRFSEKIEVRDHDDPVNGLVCAGHDLANPHGPVFRSEIQGHDTGPPPAPDGPAFSRGIQGHPTTAAQRDPVNGPALADHDPANGTDDPANQRLCWVRQQLAAGRPLRREDLEKQFGVSARTAKRDFQVLRGAGEVEFVGPAKTGHYRLTALRLGAGRRKSFNDTKIRRR